MSEAERPMRIAVAGNPNVGKTSLFNALTGMRHKVGNYPGITVELLEGTVLSAHDVGRPITLVDLPGTYSLTARSEDERLAFSALTGEVGQLDGVVVVLDATNLARNLYLLLQVLELGLPCAVALNMVDLAEEAGMGVDAEELAAALDLPVVETVARDGKGAKSLAKAIGSLPAEQRPRLVPVEDDLVARLVSQFEGPTAPARARMAVTSSLSEEKLADESLGSPAARKAAAQAVIEARYKKVDAILASLTGLDRMEGAPAMERSERIDRVVTHPVWGTLTFLVVMGLVFQLIFAWADPLVGLIESGIGWLQGAAHMLPEGTLRDLLTEGVIAGVGNVVVFLPQILILFLCIGLLEDLGYMARGAFIVDRLMSRVGLSGKSFVPLLSGYACAVPAIMTTRTIESFRDRLVTILMIPFTSCSARLPIYALLIAALFDADEPVLGPISRGGLILLGTYLVATFSALGMGFLYKKTILRGPTPPLVLELPPYRLPRLRSVLGQTWDRVKAFLTDAGTIILAATIVLWGALSFPRVDEAELAEGETAIEHSIGGKMGKAMEPALTPMGQDWRVGVGIIGSFAAREVFVSTLGMVYGIEADEDDGPLREKIQKAKDPVTGEPRYTQASGWALMIFFVYAAQCMSTLAVVKRETKSWKWPLFMFVTMSVIAYIAAVVVYQVATALGA